MANLNQLLSPIPFVVVGGVATRLYMPERMTLDLDIVIAADQAESAYQTLEDSGAHRTINSNILNSRQWRLPDESSLNVLEINEPWLEDALNSPNYSPDNLPVIDLPYLVLMKINASRSQDLADISRMLGGATEVQIEQTKIIIEKYLPTAIEDLESLILLGRLEHQ